MKIVFDEGVEDVYAAVSMGRVVRGHGPYGILIGDEKLHFSGAVIADPVPTGAQILAAAGLLQPVEHLLFRMLADGLLEEIRPEETTDLKGSWSSATTARSVSNSMIEPMTGVQRGSPGQRSSVSRAETCRRTMSGWTCRAPRTG